MSQIIAPQPYKDPIITAYIDLIKSKTDIFKGIYYGDPISVPASSMPALIVSKVATELTEFDFANDEHNIQLNFTVVTDVRKDIQDDKTMAIGTNSLYAIIEGRNVDDWTLLPESLAQILRHNVDINQGKKLYTDVGTRTKISYGMTLNKRGEGMYGIEGSITIVAKFVQFR